MIRVNGANEDFLNESVAMMLVRKGVDPRGIAVALNGEVIRRSEWETVLIGDGAAVEIVTAVAGG